MGTYSIQQLYDKIAELAAAKEALRQALIDRGAVVSTNVSLEDYPNIILSICDGNIY